MLMALISFENLTLKMPTFKFFENKTLKNPRFVIPLSLERISWKIHVCCHWSFRKITDILWKKNPKNPSFVALMLFRKKFSKNALFDVIVKNILKISLSESLISLKNPRLCLWCPLKNFHVFWPLKEYS